MFRIAILGLVCLVTSVGAACSLAGDFRSTTFAALNDIDSRIIISDEIASLGQRVEWQEHTLNELRDIRQRVLLVSYLARLGDDVDWRDYTAGALKDRNFRVWTAEFLARKYNHRVDWWEHTAAELKSIRARIEYARMLQRRYGHQVDWSIHSVAEMEEMRRKMIVAVNLGWWQGIEVDWRSVTLPGDPLKGFEPDFATLVQSLARRSGTTPAGVLALTQKAQEILRNEGLDVEIELLVSAAWEITYDVHAVGIPDCLASYGAYRRVGMDHATSVTRVIGDHALRTRTLIREEDQERYTAVTRVRSATADVGAFGWAIAYQKVILSEPSEAAYAYYVVDADIVNRGQKEIKLPASGTTLILVDQESREFSARAEVEPGLQPGRTHSGVVFRPSLSTMISYVFEVPRDSEVAGFRIREMDETVNHFGDDDYAEIRLPIDEPD